MARILWSPTGRQSLVDIAQYVVEQSESLETGIKLVDVIEDKCKTYSQFPEAGIPRDDLGKGRRCFVVGSYVVIYRPIDDGIRVILVAHGYQDLDSLIRGISQTD
ncbi:MAG TPA: type II toxin-antitoxin system RelE/ParE family toxin [Pirellulaceae bacterium]|nr:type II toxin-antitoxin system RelE/ParE family toxin [Pirellulaceae bacterium]